MSGHNDRVWYTRWTSRYRKRVYIYMYIRSFIILIRSYRVLRGPRLLAGPAEVDRSFSLTLFFITHSQIHTLFLSFSLTICLVFFTTVEPIHDIGCCGRRRRGSVDVEGKGGR